jgi:hypothetical protein
MLRHNKVAANVDVVIAGPDAIASKQVRDFHVYKQLASVKRAKGEEIQRVDRCKSVGDAVVLL